MRMCEHRRAGAGRRVARAGGLGRVLTAGVLAAAVGASLGAAGCKSTTAYTITPKKQVNPETLSSPAVREKLQPAQPVPTRTLAPVPLRSQSAAPAEAPRVIGRVVPNHQPTSARQPVTAAVPRSSRRTSLNDFSALPSTPIWNVTNASDEPIEFKLTRAEWSDFGTTLLPTSRDDQWIRMLPGEQVPFQPSDRNYLESAEVHLLVRSRGASWMVPQVERYELRGQSPMMITVTDSGLSGPRDPAVYVDVSTNAGTGLAVPVPRRYWPSVYGE